jgi:hypothetical protein
MKPDGWKENRLFIAKCHIGKCFCANVVANYRHVVQIYKVITSTPTCL